MIRPYSVLLCAFLLASGAARAAEGNLTPVPTQITCEHAEAVSTDKEMTTVFTGDVQVTGTNMRISCDRLEIISYRSGEKGQVLAKENRFKSMIATGHVRINQGDREATCGRAEVLPGDNKIILTDNPMVEDKDTGWTYTGRNLTLLRGERRVHGEKVTITGPAIKDLGFDKNLKPGNENTGK